MVDGPFDRGADLLRSRGPERFATVRPCTKWNEGHSRSTAAGRLSTMEELLDTISGQESFIADLYRHPEIVARLLDEMTAFRNQ